MLILFMSNANATEIGLISFKIIPNNVEVIAGEEFSFRTETIFNFKDKWFLIKTFTPEELEYVSVESILTDSKFVTINQYRVYPKTEDCLVRFRIRAVMTDDETEWLEDTLTVNVKRNPKADLPTLDLKYRKFTKDPFVKIYGTTNAVSLNIQNCDVKIENGSFQFNDAVLKEGINKFQAVAKNLFGYETIQEIEINYCIVPPQA